MPGPSADAPSEYAIFETDEFQRRLEKLSRVDAAAIRTKLEEYVYPQLREQPFFGTNIRKLRGYSPEVWRYRIGRFRVFYAVDQDERTVFILTIEARKDAYR